MCLRLFRAFSELAHFIRLPFFQVWSMRDYKEHNTPVLLEDLLGRAHELEMNL